VFLSGFLFMGELYHLVETNPDYNATWVKAAVVLVLGCWFGYLNIIENI